MAAAAPTLAPAQTPASAPRPLPYPLPWTALAFAVGIFWARLTTSSAFWTPPNWSFIAAIVLILFGVSRLHSKPPLASICAFIAIALLGKTQFGLGKPHDMAVLPQQFENQQVELTGFVTRASLPVFESAVAESDWRPQSTETYQQIDLQTDSIKCIEEDSCLASTQPVGVRIGIYETEPEVDSSSQRAFSTEFHYGQRLKLRGRIRLPQTYGDPGVFDRRAYLLENGIAAVMSAKIVDVETISGAGGTRWGSWRARARRSLLQHVLALRTSGGYGHVFSISRTDAALLAAMILGERSLLDQRMKVDFQRTGSYHLLVVSGMAVAILAFAVFWLARMARVPDAFATILSVIFVGLYASVTDLGAPVQRAALMCAVYMLARLFYRERNPLNAVGAAALVVLVTDPKSLFDAGFQMTFLAVLTIAGIAVPVMGRTTLCCRKALFQLGSTGFDLYLVPKQAQFRIDLRMVLARLDLFLPRGMGRMLLVGGLRVLLRAADIVFISGLMQAALALPMAVYFHRATTLALPANIVVVPIMTLLLPIALGTTLLSYLAAWIAFIPRCITALLLHAVSASVMTFARFRASDLRVPDPPIWAAILCIVALAACIGAVRRRPILVITSLVLLAGGDLAVIYARKPDIVPGKLEMTAIDVGQGDSLLVVTPQGKALLIDGGGTSGASFSGFDVGEDVVSPYLWSRGFSHLDAVALSHADRDHIGGLPAVLKNFQPTELWVAPSPSHAAYDALIAQAQASGIVVNLRIAGQKFAFGGADFDVLAPEIDAQVPSERDNDDSMVLKIAYGSASALLEGDAERRTERRIAPELGPVNLLKVAHHGSATSSIPDLLARIHPQFAVISVGKFNHYGHPKQEILQRLRQSGACTFRTDLSGALSFYLDATGIASARWGRERQTIEFPSRRIPLNRDQRCAAAR